MIAKQTLLATQLTPSGYVNSRLRQNISAVAACLFFESRCSNCSSYRIRRKAIVLFQNEFEQTNCPKPQYKVKSILIN